MWETITKLGQNPFVLIFLIGLILIILYGIKKGLFKFKGKGVEIGLSEQSTRDLIQSQFDYAKAKIEGFPNIANFPPDLDTYRIKYVLARVEDVVQKAIVFNNLNDKDSYIKSKSELVYQTVMKRVVDDFFKTDEFKETIYKFVEELFKELYQMKKDFKN